MKSLNPADFTSIFAALPGALLVIATDQTIVMANNAYLAATSTERDTIIGRKLSDVLPHAFANSNNIAAITASFQTVLSSKQSHKIPTQLSSILAIQKSPAISPKEKKNRTMLNFLTGRSINRMMLSIQ